jgi:hypothetical protein
MYITSAGTTTQYGSLIKKIKLNEASPPIRATTPTAGPWARSDKDKSELFAQHFAYIFTPRNDAKDHETEKSNSSYKITPNSNVTSPKEIKEVIKSLGLKKVPGLDQVTPKMLKERPQKGIALLTYILI